MPRAPLLISENLQSSHVLKVPRMRDSCLPAPPDPHCSFDTPTAVDEVVELLLSDLQLGGGVGACYLLVELAPQLRLEARGKTFGDQVEVERHITWSDMDSMLYTNKDGMSNGSGRRGHRGKMMGQCRSQLEQEMEVAGRRD